MLTIYPQECKAMIAEFFSDPSLFAELSTEGMGLRPGRSVFGNLR
jgi:hypothetical protein